LDNDPIALSSALSKMKLVKFWTTTQLCCSKPLSKNRIGKISEIDQIRFGKNAEQTRSYLFDNETSVGGSLKQPQNLFKDQACNQEACLKNYKPCTCL